jgi:Asp-tRNA(Asn)/Glu-tRNA(Gln) amidotransferase A subunit family amidase
MTYDLKPMKAPRLAGAALKVATFLAESPATAQLLSNKLLGDAGILALRDHSTDEPLASEHPLFAECGSRSDSGGAAVDLARLASPGAQSNEFSAATTGDYAAAYRSGRLTPEAVAEQVLVQSNNADQRDPPMRVFIAQDAEDVMKQARASTQRHKDGATLGPLDGVPVAVKDELDQAPYPTTVGTRFLGTEAASTDAEVVRRLRDAGAILIGKANMHEIGLGVTGLNPHHGSARNPYNPLHATGGSSSGPAAAVAMGLCPLAVGADGGGSIRIPAALTGIVGLKATFGRISEHGAAPLCWSLAHVGPLAATANDAALGYMLMAGPDPKDRNTARQPAPHLDGLENSDLSGLKLGVYRPWFEDAEPDVVENCDRMLAGLKDAGAEVHAIDLPELGLMSTVHLVTICNEMAASHVQLYKKHRKDYSLETRLALALARQMLSCDYVHAQRHRTRLCKHFYDALHKVDCIVTPATGRTAPVLPTDALKSGESNLEVVSDIMRFAQPANLTGLPAISFPAGYDGKGLPVGMQVMGRPWAEHTLLRIARCAESLMTRQKPAVHVSQLD